VIDAVSITGGHLGAGLGVGRAHRGLHYLFDTPDDILIWDVGHRPIPTRSDERRDRIRTFGRAAGFRDSPGAARASTTPSAPPTARPRSRGAGLATARSLRGEPGHVVAVIATGR